MKALLFCVLGSGLATGCLPYTVNATRGQPSVCPVHHIAMKKMRTDIVGIAAPIQRDKAFPYAGYPQYGGCIPPQPMWAKVYECSDCGDGYLRIHGHDPSKF